MKAEILIFFLAVDVLLLIMMIFGYNVLFKRMDELSKLHGMALEQFDLINSFMGSNIKTFESQESINKLFADFTTNQTTINVGVGSSLKELFSKVNQ